MKRTNGRGNKRMSAIVYKDFTYKDKEAVSSSKVKFVCLLVWVFFYIQFLLDIKLYVELSFVFPQIGLHTLGTLDRFNIISPRKKFLKINMH